MEADLRHAELIGKQLGLDSLYIKNDSVNPTFSFKDRPVAITTTKALEFGFEVLACVSTGNLMGSVAAHGSKANLETYVFYPQDLELSKIYGAAVYGSKMIAIEGNYDDYKAKTTNNLKCVGNYVYTNLKSNKISILLDNQHRRRLLMPHIVVAGTRINGARDLCGQRNTHVVSRALQSTIKSSSRSPTI